MRPDGQNGTEVISIGTHRATHGAAEIASVPFCSFYGYVSCPVCSPTRAGLMTGRYQQRFGHEFNPGPAKAADTQFGLPLTETTFANRMKSLGYATGMVGKWHLGYQPELHPLKRGFDEYFGFLGGAAPSPACSPASTRASARC